MRGRWLVCGVSAAIFLALGGCALGPMKSSSAVNAPSDAERDMLASAARAVETVPWPKPQPISFFERITGGGESRVTRSDAVAAYVATLLPAGESFQKLAVDASANLDAATQLNRAAKNTALAARLSANDVAVIEGAIRVLRENHHIYAAAAKDLSKIGKPVDEIELQAIRDAYGREIKALSETADFLAERLEDDRSQTYAGPDKTIHHKLSGT